ncbi:vinorine synthase-like [Chenopodium quinoa]|uniref:vinorine synthase-like n=1 Tax=Chenopodium quinoa TaxID=63459 RepID=UPI000B794AAA|nr:vinorine synthase-like [Chenopodium quinoa]
MELEMETISTEIIEPSTPTPPHLKTFKLSLLDQFYQFTYVPHVLFYNPSPPLENGTKNDQKMTTYLKDSLSKTLSLFYPLAGRLTMDESSIDCNDKGISFVETRVLNCSLSTFLEASNRVDLVGRFLSETIYDDQLIDKNKNIHETKTVTELVPLAIQVNIFNCGGFAIGSQWLHKFCDAVSWGNFLKNWAAIAAGLKENVTPPEFATAISLFPPCDLIQPSGLKPRTLKPPDDALKTGRGGCIVRSFLFTPQAINALQALAISEHVPNPTRVEVVSGFIWKHAMAAVATTANDRLCNSVPSICSSNISHAVNMRPRTNPWLSSACFGNLIIDAIAHYEGENEASQRKAELSDLVARIRNGLAPFKDAEFLSKFQGEGGAQVMGNYKKKLKDENDSITTYKFTSWSKLDMKPDFGFGLPVWVGFTGGRLSSSFKNLIPLIETLDHGIEAWLILDEQQGSVLQSDPDFLQFASPISS